MMKLVIETAICGNADVQATFNLKDMRDAGRRFGIHAQRPGPLLDKDAEMSKGKIQLRLPETCKDAVLRPGFRIGRQHEFVCGHGGGCARRGPIGGRAYFKARGSRTTPERAMALLNRLGTPGTLREEDASMRPTRIGTWFSRLGGSPAMTQHSSGPGQPLQGLVRPVPRSCGLPVSPPCAPAEKKASPSGQD